MSKIELSPVPASNYPVTAINNRLQQIEDALNDDVLWRDNPVDEPNSMSNALDMATNEILNLPLATHPTHPVRLDQVGELIDLNPKWDILQDQVDVLDSRVDVLESEVDNLQTYIYTIVDTVSQLSLLSLPLGAKAETKGFSQVGLGGGDFIVENPSGSPDGAGRVLLANGLHAVLQPPYDVRQFGAIGSGDDTIALQRFIDFMSGKAAVINEGVFSVSTLILPDNTRLVVNGSATIKRLAATSSHLIVAGNNTFIVGTGSIDGNSSQNTGDLHNIYINGKSNVVVTIAGNKNMVGDGWAVYGSGDYIKVRKSRISDGKHGVKFFNARWSSVHNCEFVSVPFYSVLGDGNSVRYGKSISVKNNVMRSSGGIVFLCVVMSVWPGAVDDGSGLVFRATAPSVGDWYDHNQPYYSGVSICGNEFTSCPAYAIITRAEYVKIQGNTIDGCSYSAIVPQGRHISAIGNVINNCASVGADLGNCAWITFKGNTIRNCTDIGIEVTCVNFGNIAGNVVGNCGTNTKSPIDVSNGSFYSLYGVAKETLISTNTVRCNALNLSGIRISGSVNTLSGYIVESNNIAPFDTPAVGFKEIDKASAINKFNCMISQHSYNGQIAIGGAEVDKCALTVNPAATNVNGIRVDGGGTGSPVTITTSGEDAEVDLVLATKGTASRVRMAEQLMWRPFPADNPTNNGDMIFERTSNTSLTIRLRGTDGVVRSVALTLA